MALWAAMSANVLAQEELPLGDPPEELVTPSPFDPLMPNLAALGLCGMRVMSDEEVLAGRCPPVEPPAPFLHGPPVIGQRQLFILQHMNPDPLPRKAWRWAHRTQGF